MRRFQRAGKLWKVEDQRFVHDRPDVISFQAEPLADDAEAVGRIVAYLHASASDYQSAVQRVYCSARHPSRIRLSIAELSETVQLLQSRLAERGRVTNSVSVERDGNYFPRSPR